MTLLSGLGAFFAYFGLGVGCVCLFLALYLPLTAHRELALIRAGNTSAAIALGGTLLGYCLPLASAIAHGVSLVDAGLWAAVALVAQVAAHALVRLLLPGFPRRIEAGDAAAATLSAAVHLGVGLLNAAAMVY